MKIATRLVAICTAAVLALANHSSANVLFEDTFAGTSGPVVGTTPGIGGNWTAVNVNSDQILFSAASLAAPSGLRASTGNKLTWGGAGEDAKGSFASQNAGTVYYSFLLRLTANSGSTNGSSIVSLGSGANFAASLAIRRQATGDTTKYNVGIFSRQTSNGPQWSPALLSPGTTYLIVVAYQFVPGTGNDVVKLWIDPSSFGGSEPSPTLSAVNPSGDISFLDFVQLWQRDSATPTSVQLDELRIGTTWAAVTPTSIVDVVSYPIEAREVRTGTNAAVLQENWAVRPGQSNTSTSLIAGVLTFQLPDLKGGTISSAKVKFQVTGNGNMTATNFADLNLEALRSSALSQRTILVSDFSGIGLNGATSIESGIAKWNDGGYPRNYETSAIAGDILSDWLVDQYNSVGVGGVVYLRFSPSQSPNSNFRQYVIPNSSVQLVITTEGQVDPSRGFGNTVTAQVGVASFSWTFDRSVQWGRFIDGQPWVVMPPSGTLNLISATPSRKNAQAVHLSGGVATIADIDITVKNPPFDHVYNGTDYIDNPAGVAGWDSRFGPGMDAQSSPKYNASLGWDGVTPLPLAAGDNVTTPKSLIANPMPDRATPLEALAVLTVLSAAPPEDAFRPGVIRPASGPDRTNPEILRYSNLIAIAPSQLIANPVGTTDLRNVTVTGISPNYLFYRLRNSLPGPGFLNTGDSKSEGANARLNTQAFPPSGGVSYGGSIGLEMGKLAIGSLAGWLTEEERKFCRIRFIQRAIDAYSAVKAGLCVEESAGILPGYSTLITTAGVMLNHAGMKSVNDGVNGYNPHIIFADYATHVHFGDVPASDLAVGEAQNDRRVPTFYDPAVTPLFPTLNKKDIQPIASAALDGTTGTMTMKTDFFWAGGRPINNIINLKVRVTAGPGAGDTIYVITESITSNVTDAEKFRTASGTLYNSGNVDGYRFGGKVRLKPAWQNGIPDSTSTLALSVSTRDTAPGSVDDIGKWFWQVGGISPTRMPATVDVAQANTSPIAEYSEIHSGATIDNLIALYALGGQALYKGGLDKYLIHAGERPGYGEVLFANGSYMNALGTGTAGNTRGALWKQKVLTPLGKSFVFTGQGTAALEVPRPEAKMWYQP